MKGGDVKVREIRTRIWIPDVWVRAGIRTGGYIDR